MPTRHIILWVGCGLAECANIADGLTTAVIVGYCHAQEADPITAFAIHVLGLVPGLATVKSTVALALVGISCLAVVRHRYWTLRLYRLVFVSLWLVAIGYGYAAVHNTYGIVLLSAIPGGCAPFPWQMR